MTSSMASPNLNAMAERVEKEAPSRALDIEVGRMTTDPKAWRIDDDGSAYATDGDGWFLNGEVPHFTSSIDAVKTLEPKGANITVKYAHGIAYARIAWSGVEAGESYLAGDHAEPRARLAAVLRALAAETD